MLLLKECFQIYMQRLNNTSDRAEPSAELEALRKRVKWRSAERGTRENELILRSFCAEHLNKMNLSQLQQFERLLSTDDVSDPDLYKYLTGAKPVPPAVAELEVYKMLAAHVNSKNLALKGAAF
jgi:succinate dehydrogenase flavin-adding protein (antitoxin of CptAB toxin-antitoxin module)